MYINLQYLVDSKPSKVEVPVSKTQVHTIKIVLPVHANHHGTTFGGQVCSVVSMYMIVVCVFVIPSGYVVLFQIMEWVTDVATISAL